MSDKKVPTFSDYLHQKKDRVYFNSFTDAVSYVYDLVSVKFKIDEDDWFNQIASGGKPGTGKTKIAHIDLYNKKTGEKVSQNAHIQVYNSGNTFELNYYLM
jgi:hypothetical protein